MILNNFLWEGKNNMSEKKSKNSNMSRLAVAQVVVLLLLTMFMVHFVCTTINKNSVNHVLVLAQERSNTIISYVENAEQTLCSYSCADEITNILSNPENEEYIKAAQEYTEKISGNIKNLEGIYVSEWNTHVLAHTNKSGVGITTRNGERLTELQNLLLNAENGVYNAGIIASPASGAQIVSIYKAVYDKGGKPIGLVGIGIYTTDVVSQLGKQGLADMPQSFYSMIDVNNGRYIFHSDTEKINTQSDIEELTALCDEFKGNTYNKTGTFKYKKDKKGYISVYNYMGDRGWLFMLDDTNSEFYALTYKMSGFLAVFILFYILIVAFFSAMNKKNLETAEKLESSIRKNARTKESLNTAVYNDILTDTKNRISFTNDFEIGKVKDSADYPYYFAMFNISGFSGINITYGDAVGDAVLATVADTLRSVFKEAKLYRTGSDEFVAVVQCQSNSAGLNRMNGFVNNALEELMKPVNTSAGPVPLKFRASIVKKGISVDASVLSALKDIVNNSNTAVPGQVGFMDLDNM